MGGRPRKQVGDGDRSEKPSEVEFLKTGWVKISKNVAIVYNNK